jgi:hypothetical protein
MFWDVILGHYFGTTLPSFGMKINYDNIVFSAEKENTLLTGPKQFFFSVSQLKKKRDRFSSQNIVPDDMKKTNKVKKITWARGTPLQKTPCSIQ